MAAATHRQFQLDLFAALDGVAAETVRRFNIAHGTSFQPSAQLAEWHAAAVPLGDNYRPVRVRADHA